MKISTALAITTIAFITYSLLVYFLFKLCNIGYMPYQWNPDAKFGYGLLSGVGIIAYIAISLRIAFNEFKPNS